MLKKNARTIPILTVRTATTNCTAILDPAEEMQFTPYNPACSHNWAWAIAENAPSDFFARDHQHILQYSFSLDEGGILFFKWLRCFPSDPIASTAILDSAKDSEAHQAEALESFDHEGTPYFRSFVALQF